VGDALAGAVRPLRALETYATPVVSTAPHASAYRDVRLSSAQYGYTTPAYYTLGQARSVHLQYVSGTARPLGFVQVDATDNSLVPAARTSIRLRTAAGADVTLVGGLREAFYQSGSGATRLAAEFQADDLPSGAWPYDVIVTSYWNDGTVRQAPPVRIRVPIVNEAASPFGAGWTRAGQQRLYDQGDGAFITRDGTGSFFEHPCPACGWTAPAGDLTRLSRDADGTWVRAYPDGTRVRFTAGGVMQSVTQRTGSVTRYDYDGAGRLAWITDPVGRRTAFAYDAGGSLAAITDPAGRATTFVARGGDLAEIRDAAGAAVFRGAYGEHRLAFYYGPRGAGDLTNVEYRPSTLTYEYTEGPEVWTEAGPRRPLTRVLTQEFATLYHDGAGTASNPAPRLRPEDVRVWVFDARGAVTRLALDAYGQPTRIEDALGNVTTIDHDARFPTLVTRVDAPGGGAPNGSAPGVGPRSVTTAQYDDLGRVTVVTKVNPLGDGVSPYTYYEYFDPRWPYSVGRITSPRMTLTTMGYDSATGNLLWRQVGRDSLRRVRFGYGRWGLADTVWSAAARARGEAPEVVERDSVGNVAAVRSPLGFRSTYTTDALGRVAAVRSPVDAAQTAFARDSSVYDAMNRVVEQRTSGPAMNGAPAQAVDVRSAYQPGSGDLLSVTRADSADAAGIGVLATRWRYDALGRRVAEVAPASPADAAAGTEPEDSTVYDVAGSPVRVVTRTGDTIAMEYDVLGRLTKRRTSAVAYPLRREGIPAYRTTVMDDPVYGAYTPWEAMAEPAPLVIAADSAVFAYDGGGRMLRADNADARIARSYYPGGLLRTDSLRIRTAAELSAGGSFDAHAYGIAYAYDTEGRRTSVTHPTQLAPVPGAATRYAYTAGMDELESVTDPLGNVFGYHWDGSGRPDTLYMPRGIAESYAWDADDRLATHAVRDAAGTYVRLTRYGYDPRGKATSWASDYGAREHGTAAYTGLGHLASTGFTAYGALMDNTSIALRYGTTTRYANDALGNRTYDWEESATYYQNGGTYKRSWREDYTAYEPGTGRNAVRRETNGQRDTVRYDAAGNTVFTTQAKVAYPTGYRLDDRASYYAADGSLRATDTRSMTSPTSLYPPYRRVFEEYRYDALGRRVWVRAHRYCENQPTDFTADECGLGTVRRTVWDGDQVLYEVQAPGDDSASAATLENDTVPVRLRLTAYYNDLNPFFGTVAYTHGPAVDQPLSITRIRYVDRPYADTLHVWAPFSFVPLWNRQGDADNGYFADTGPRHCLGTSTSRCVRVELPAGWKPFGQQGDIVRSTWVGSLLEQQIDRSGLAYRRNRMYDPVTGRFTQEDPIGLAGGVNLYGYASADPVTYSDPYGLCTKADGWKDCDKMVTVDQSTAIHDAAYDSGEWHYTQGGAHHGDEPPVNLAQKYGDCTDFTWNATKQGLGAAWNHSYAEKPNTHAFLHGEARGYTEVEASSARPGDVVVLGGHAGIFDGFAEDASGGTRVLGHANNGSPAYPDKAGRDGNTGPFDFTGNARLTPHFYRPIIEHR
jgi:RHS repeat-associated protein